MRMECFAETIKGVGGWRGPLPAFISMTTESGTVLLFDVNYCYILFIMTLFPLPAFISMTTESGILLPVVSIRLPSPRR